MPINTDCSNGSGFGPDDIIIMVVAFEDACGQLGYKPDDPGRQEVARRVFACAQTGERDACRLRSAGLGHSY